MDGSKANGNNFFLCLLSPLTLGNQSHDSPNLARNYQAQINKDLIPRVQFSGPLKVAYSYNFSISLKFIRLDKHFIRPGTIFLPQTRPGVNAVMFCFISSV